MSDNDQEEWRGHRPGSNLPFSEWGSIIPDPRLVAAIVDRLTFHAHIIETGNESHRLRATRATKARERERVDADGAVSRNLDCRAHA